MIRAAAIALGVVGVVAFPWPYALLLGFIAALYMPGLGIALGVLSDALYYSHAAAFVPWGTVAGALVSVAAYFARRFLKTRVTDFSYPAF